MKKLLAITLLVYCPLSSAMGCIPPREYVGREDRYILEKADIVFQGVPLTIKDKIVEENGEICTKRVIKYKVTKRIKGQFDTIDLNEKPLCIAPKHSTENFKQPSLHLEVEVVDDLHIGKQLNGQYYRDNCLHQISGAVGDKLHQK